MNKSKLIADEPWTVAGWQRRYQLGKGFELLIRAAGAESPPPDGNRRWLGFVMKGTTFQDDHVYEMQRAGALDGIATWNNEYETPHFDFFEKDFDQLIERLAQEHDGQCPRAEPSVPVRSVVLSNQGQPRGYDQC